MFGTIVTLVSYGFKSQHCLIIGKRGIISHNHFQSAIMNTKKGEFVSLLEESFALYYKIEKMKRDT